MKGVLAGLILLAGFSVKAQPTYFNKAYNLGAEEIFGGTVEATDSSYLVVGQTILANESRELVTAVFSDTGQQNMTWVHGDSIWSYELQWLTKLPNEEFLCGSAARNRQNGQYDLLVIKLNANGDTIWWRQFGDSVLWEVSTSAILAEDGNYVITCFHNTLGAPLWGQTVLIKMDTAGNIIWQKQHGVANKTDYPRGLVQTRDSGFLIVGDLHGPFAGDDKDLMLIKTDSVGEHEWTKYYGIAGGDGWGGAIVKSLEGGYMVSGFREIIQDTEFRGWLVKLDEDGNMEWDKLHQHEGNKKTSFWESLIQLPDSSYVVIGTVEQSSNRDMGLVVKFGVTGDSIWSRAYTRDKDVNHYFYDLDTTSDGGFIICGSTTASGSTQDGWLLKLNELGCDIPGCQLATSIPEFEIGYLGIQVYPNPNPGQFEVNLRQSFNRDAELQLYDLLGHLVYSKVLSKGVSKSYISVDLPFGSYLLTVTSTEGKWSQQVVID